MADPVDYSLYELDYTDEGRERARRDRERTAELRAAREEEDPFARFDPEPPRLASYADVTVTRYRKAKGNARGTPIALRVFADAVRTSEKLRGITEHNRDLLRRGLTDERARHKESGVPGVAFSDMGARTGGWPVADPVLVQVDLDHLPSDLEAFAVRQLARSHPACVMSAISLSGVGVFALYALGRPAEDLGDYKAAYSVVSDLWTSRGFPPDASSGVHPRMLRFAAYDPDAFWRPEPPGRIAWERPAPPPAQTALLPPPPAAERTSALDADLGELLARFASVPAGRPSNRNEMLFETLCRLYDAQASRGRGAEHVPGVLAEARAKGLTDSAIAATRASAERTQRRPWRVSRRNRANALESAFRMAAPRPRPRRWHEGEVEGHDCALPSYAPDGTWTAACPAPA